MLVESVSLRALRVNSGLDIVQASQLFEVVFEIFHEREATRSLRLILEISWRRELFKNKKEA